MNRLLPVVTAGTGLMALAIAVSVFFVVPAVAKPPPVSVGVQVSPTVSIDVQAPPVSVDVQIPSDCSLVRVVIGQAKTTWSPGQVSASLKPGEYLQMPVRLTAPDGLEPTTVQVAPALAPYLQVSPTTIPCLRRGGTQDFTLTFSTPIDATQATTTGAIQLQASEKLKSGESVGKPLPVALTINPPPSNVTKNGVVASFRAPSGWVAVSNPSAQTAVQIYSTSSIAEINAGSEGLSPDLAVSLVDNSSHAALADFIDSRADGWYNSYGDRQQRQVQGHDAIIISDEQVAVPHYPIIVAFIDLTAVVLIISADVMSSSDFDAFLSTIQIQ